MTIAMMMMIMIMMMIIMPDNDENNDRFLNVTVPFGKGAENRTIPT